MSGEQDGQAFRDFYSETKARLDREMKEYNQKLADDENAVIRPFMEALGDLNSGGKMLRGMLVVLGYRIACRIKNEAKALAPESDPVYADSLALAFELFQTGVLVHDDIIDRAETRRGKRTIQNRYAKRLTEQDTPMAAAGISAGHVADSAALCAGDFGLYLANLMIAESYEGNEQLGRLVSYFDETVLETIRGELLDVVLPYEFQSLSDDEEERAKLLERSVRDIYRLKTARYSVVGPLHLGMLLGRAEKEELQAMDLFAEDLGVAFQIQDDILGIYADPETLGKDVGSDISEYKQTILYAFVRAYAREYEEKLLLYYGKEHVSEDDIAAVRNLFRESGALGFARSRMDACFKRAENLLGGMDFVHEEERRILRGFIAYLRSREK